MIVGVKPLDPAPISDAPPTLAALFLCFTVIGMQSFGGGLSSWMRREVVQRRGWMEDPQFLGGLALAQIAPGPNAVNLCVFIGTTLRGGSGALVALAGLMGLPIALVLALGGLYGWLQKLPGLAPILGGMGAAAVGLNLATGWRLTRRNLRSLSQFAIMIFTALAVGWLDWPLLPVLLVVVPASLALSFRRR
jgi:chromate transporter